MKLPSLKIPKAAPGHNQKLWHKVQRYLPIVFILTFALLYGFIVLQINLLSGAEPSESDITSQGQTLSQPNVDPAVLKKIQELQDNSETVQVLFEQARQNPFQD